MIGMITAQKVTAVEQLKAFHFSLSPFQLAIIGLMVCASQWHYRTHLITFWGCIKKENNICWPLYNLVSHHSTDKPRMPWPLRTLQSFCGRFTSCKNMNYMYQAHIGDLQVNRNPYNHCVKTMDIYT